MGARIRSALAAVLLPLFWLVPTAAAVETLVPVGQTVGLDLETEGVYVLQFDGDDAPAKVCGLKAGDRIVRVNGCPLEQAEQLRTAAEESRGEELILDVDRGGKAMRFTIRPKRADSGWKLGLFLQDRISGLGTVTFYDPETGLFGALGHGVNEAASSCPMAIAKGAAVAVDITAVQKGAPGTPGCLKGSAGSGGLLGVVELNTADGIFGHALGAGWSGPLLHLAAQREITTGPAEIWSSAIGGMVEKYSVSIEEISFDAQSGRNLKLRVTDPRLLEATGGIVRGMSGSPILQNGRLIGAVTHVLIQDPARGYGIFIENMLAGYQDGEENQAA